MTGTEGRHGQRWFEVQRLGLRQFRRFRNRLHLGFCNFWRVIAYQSVIRNGNLGWFSRLIFWRQADWLNSGRIWKDFRATYCREGETPGLLQKPHIPSKESGRRDQSCSLKEGPEVILVPSDRRIDRHLLDNVIRGSFGGNGDNGVCDRKIILVGDHIDSWVLGL